MLVKDIRSKYPIVIEALECMNGMNDMMGCLVDGFNVPEEYNLEHIAQALSKMDGVSTLDYLTANEAEVVKWLSAKSSWYPKIIAELEGLDLPALESLCGGEEVTMDAIILITKYGDEANAFLVSCFDGDLCHIFSISNMYE